jgi:hypothetical protein
MEYKDGSIYLFIVNTSTVAMRKTVTKAYKFYNETFSSVALTSKTDISAHLPVLTTADLPLM